MNEKEILESLRKDAEGLKIPERIKPEQIKKKLDAQKLEDTQHTKTTAESLDKAERKKSKFYMQKNRWMGAAATIAVMILLGVSARSVTLHMSADESAQTSASSSGGHTQVESDSTSTQETADDGKAESVRLEEMYQVAADYGDVYDTIEEATKASEEDGFFSFFSGATTEILESVQDSETSGAAENSQAATDSAQSSDAYSSTNVQTAGVDESDIVKTDGKYLYVVDGNRINICSIQDGVLKEMSSIQPSFSSAADEILEMYVQGDILSLIVQQQSASLDESSGEDTTYVEEGEGATLVGQSTASQDIYTMNTKAVVSIYEYNISDRSNAKLIGTTQQDGYYQTSRKVDTIIYLFTNKTLELPEGKREDVILTDQAASWMPQVNDQMIAADDIYIEEAGTQALVIGSYDCRYPEKIIDSKMLVNSYVQIYVSETAVYLYQSNYENQIYTQIAKFAMKKGKLTPIGAASVSGEIMDTFAINEQEGMLRVLTTDWSGDTQKNQVYVLDENLKLTGQINDLAAGESIYSARFLGDIGYFVTYRNTDPLFTVDFSDPKQPTVIGELKVSGFSEYLHFWGEDKLLGIGYETNADTGETIGVKLSMFDISNPAQVKECAKYVIKNADYSPALYDYKSVLVDVKANLIGVAVESYEERTKSQYVVFAYEDGAFENRLVESVDSTIGADQYRGIYAGDYFYLVGGGKIMQYAREDFHLLEKLE